MLRRLHPINPTDRQQPNKPLRPPLLVNGKQVNPNKVPQTLESIEQLEEMKKYDALAYEDAPPLILSRKQIAQRAPKGELAREAKEHACGTVTTPKVKVTGCHLEKIVEFLMGERDEMVDRDKNGLRLPTAYAMLCPRCKLVQCVCGRDGEVRVLLSRTVEVVG